MSFGFSVGDIVTLAQLANNAFKKFLNAPREYEAIKSELNSLWVILEEVEDARSHERFTERQLEQLQPLLHACHSLLHDLTKTLIKYRDLETSSRTTRDRAHIIWKRLQHEPDDIRDLRRRIISALSSLTAFNQEVLKRQLEPISCGVNRLNKAQDNEERRKIADWLSATDYFAMQKDYESLAEEETGQWFLNSTEFRKWRDGECLTLLCQGIPGAGKTVLSAICVEHLQTLFGEDAEVAIVCQFYVYKRQGEQTPLRLTSNLLKQIYQQHLGHAPELQTLYERHSRAGTRPSLKEIVEIILVLSAGFRRIFLILDALDENTDEEGGRTLFLSELFKLQSHTINRLSILITSRPVPAITNLPHFVACVRAEIRASDSDVDKYLSTQLLHFDASLQKFPKLMDNIKQTIIGLVNGVFLLAKLHLDSLRDKTTRKKIQKALEALPSGGDALETAYKSAIERIDSQRAGHKDLARKILFWLTLSKVSLNIHQLQEALSIEENDTELVDEADFEDPALMVSVCAGLVVEDGESGTIRFVHETVQTFLNGFLSSWIPEATENVAIVLLTYLCFDHFRQPPSFEDPSKDPYDQTDSIYWFEEFYRFSESHQLYQYVSLYWGTHSEQSFTQRVQTLGDAFLHNQNCLMCATDFMFIYNVSSIPGGPSYLAKPRSALQLAIYMGLETWASRIFAQLDSTSGMSPDESSSALLYAAGRGSLGIVKMLLTSPGSDINKAADMGEAPLLVAAEGGHLELVKWLCYLPDINLDIASTVLGQNVAHYSVRTGSAAMVEFLLSIPGINFRCEDKLRTTPLMHAANSAHFTEIFKIIYEAKVDIGHELDALVGAASYGNIDVVKLLTQDMHNMNINEMSDGYTALHAAAAASQTEVIQYLHATCSDLDLNAETRSGKTALMLAAGSYHPDRRLEAIKILIGLPEVNVFKTDQSGRTVFHHAANWGNFEEIRFLFASVPDIDINHKDRRGETVLMLAIRCPSLRSREEKPRIVKFLLSLPTLDLEATNNEGQTALLIAEEEEQEGKIRESRTGKVNKPPDYVSIVVLIKQALTDRIVAKSRSLSQLTQDGADPV